LVDDIPDIRRMKQIDTLHGGRTRWSHNTYPDEAWRVDDRKDINWPSWDS
jgi:hypothetical protein